MKKLQTLIAAFLLSIFSATSAMSEYAVGVTGAYALLDASGTETEGGENTSTDVDHNFGLASIFAEYTMGSITMGLDYIPFAADVSENVREWLKEYSLVKLGHAQLYYYINKTSWINEK